MISCLAMHKRTKARHICSIVLPFPLALGACSLVGAPDGAQSVVNTGGYEIEDLPVVISASYVRGDDVYLGLDTGEVCKASDSRFTEPWKSLGNPLGGGPRLLFASRAGALFTAADQHPMRRSSDDGATWQVCLDVPVWRMDEDDVGNLYAGNYMKDPEHVATLYKSADTGATWTPVFVDGATQHIHSVRWDQAGQRLYIAFGDGPERGQAYSDDRGATWQIIVRGPQEGDTDVALTRDFVFWCTDNGSGQIQRVDRATGATRVFAGVPQNVWFAVAAGEQIYAGTVTALEFGGDRAVLVASADQGQTWQKLSETALSTGPYSQGFFAESRELSAGGWLYCTGGDQHGPRSYRIRRSAGR